MEHTHRESKLSRCLVILQHMHFIQGSQSFYTRQHGAQVTDIRYKEVRTVQLWENLQELMHKYNREPLLKDMSSSPVSKEDLVFIDLRAVHTELARHGSQINDRSQHL